MDWGEVPGPFGQKRLDARTLYAIARLTVNVDQGGLRRLFILHGFVGSGRNRKVGLVDKRAGSGWQVNPRACSV